MSSDRLRAHAAMVLTALIWGASFTLMKLALREISPLEMTLLRYPIAAFGFAAVLLICRGSLPSIPKCDWVRTLAAALTGIVGYGVVVSIGLQNSASSITGLINTIVPVFTLILSYFFLGERLTRNKLFGIIIALCGVILIVVRGSGDADFTIASIIGPILVTTAMFSWSIYSVLAKPLLADYPAISFTALMMILGTILMSPAAMVIDWSNLPHVSPIVWIAAAFAGIGSTLIGQLLWNYSLTILDASQVSVYMYLVPVTTLISAILLLGEVVTVYFVLGGALIVVGVALTQTSSFHLSSLNNRLAEHLVRLEPDD